MDPLFSMILVYRRSTYHRENMALGLARSLVCGSVLYGEISLEMFLKCKYVDVLVRYLVVLKQSYV